MFGDVQRQFPPGHDVFDNIDTEHSRIRDIAAASSLNGPDRGRPRLHQPFKFASDSPVRTRTPEGKPPLGHSRPSSVSPQPRRSSPSPPRRHQPTAANNDNVEALAAIKAKDTPPKLQRPFMVDWLLTSAVQSSKPPTAVQSYAAGAHTGRQTPASAIENEPPMRSVSQQHEGASAAQPIAQVEPPVGGSQHAAPWEQFGAPEPTERHPQVKEAPKPQSVVSNTTGPGHTVDPDYDYEPVVKRRYRKRAPAGTSGREPKLPEDWGVVDGVRAPPATPQVQAIETAPTLLDTGAKVSLGEERNTKHETQAALPFGLRPPSGSISTADNLTIKYGGLGVDDLHMLEQEHHPTDNALDRSDTFSTVTGRTTSSRWSRVKAKIPTHKIHAESPQSLRRVQLDDEETKRIHALTLRSLRK